ncbi:MAG: hypothetical protein ACOYH4_03610 [Saccharofermentanales bacterium]|jgi:hypothetical protein
MQLTDIQWAFSRDNEPMRHHETRIGRGLTCMDGSVDRPLDSPIDDLEFQWIASPDVPSVLTDAPEVEWQWTFNDEDTALVFATTEPDAERAQFFRHIIVGRESARLGARLDWERLADTTVSDDEKKEHVAALTDKWRQLRDQWLGTGTTGGKLERLSRELRECDARLAEEEGQIVDESATLRNIDANERLLQDTAMRQRRLAEEQRLLKWLAIKSEYETLLDLRRTLKEAEEREGVYGSRITNDGHDITVHELTELARQRAYVRELETELATARHANDASRLARRRAEQERIVATRELQDIERERMTRGHRPIAPEALAKHSAAPPPPRETSFLTPAHIIFLVALLFVAIGLFVVPAHAVAGWILFALGAVGALLFGAGLLWNRRRRTDAEAWLPDVADAPSPAKEAADDAEGSLEQAYLEQSRRLEKATETLKSLDDRGAESDVHLDVMARELALAERDLLRAIKRYAGPCEMEEVDDVIDTLTRQRNSSAKHNEFVSDLLRQIADLKHGRSDEEMVREYEYACEQLYGRDGDIQTTALHYDPERAREISDERVEAAETSDRLTADIAAAKAALKASRDATVSIGSLRQRRQTIAESLREGEAEARRLASSVAWLEGLLDAWEAIDPQAWMSSTSAITARLMGHRSASGLPVIPIALDTRALRTPKSLVERHAQNAAPKIDADRLASAPPEMVYLASRLALSALYDDRPMIWLAPNLPSEQSRIDELIDVMEEWTLETGRQIVVWTTHAPFIERVRLRKLPVVRIFG